MAGESFLGVYFWFLLKNILGWTLIIASWPLGILIPGPGGIPLFLIGFAMVTFPGKRKLTARVLRGRRFDPRQLVLRWLAAALAVMIPPLSFIFLAKRYAPAHEIRQWGWPGRLAFYLIAIAAIWLLMQLCYRLVNLLLQGMPLARRKIRPWLRDHGIHLLPPRRRRRRQRGDRHPSEREGEDEIITFHQRLSRYWNNVRPWISRLIGLGLAAVVFGYFFWKISRRWDQIRDAVTHVSLWQLLLASVLFALFLFLFRVISWRHILAGLGYRLPLAPATRIWSTSELARYLPGTIWQVVGRVYLVKPYGVSGSICSTSQILELIIFLLANTVLAVSCLLWLGFKELDPRTRPYLGLSLVLIPVLLTLLHPRVFYGLTNRVLRRLGKPPIVRQLSRRTILGLTLWAMLGLLWQSLALWLIVHQPLGLPLAKWWVIAGAYCLAWVAGFLAVWSPGGIGVREFVFVVVLMLVLPEPAKNRFVDPQALKAFLGFLSILLRLWATLGELLVAAIAHAADYRGALGHINPLPHQAREIHSAE